MALPLSAGPLSYDHIEVLLDAADDRIEDYASMLANPDARLDESARDYIAGVHDTLTEARQALASLL